MNDIKKKLMHFNFRKEIPLKLNRPKKIQNGEFLAKRPLKPGEIWRSTFSMIFKICCLEGVFDFCIRTPNLTKILNPQEICSNNFYIYSDTYMGIVFNIS